MSGTGAVLEAASAHSSILGQAGAAVGEESRTTHDVPKSTTTSHESLSSSNQPLQTGRGGAASTEHGRAPPREDNRRAIRRRSMDIVAEANGDVLAFINEMDQKRRQLDDQIHKFIAQKEREFKRYEQEMRRKYQTMPVDTDQQDGSTPFAHGTQQPSGPSTGDHGSNTAPNAHGDTEVLRDSGNLRSRIDRRTANSGLEDARSSHEREKDFMGLFTPSFLPLLDGKHELNRSPSAPLLTESGAAEPLQPDRSVLQRANTEPIMDASGQRRPGFGQRTASSGSEGLISALKTSSTRKPKPMRVMIQLADDEPAVHPNDDVPTEREYAPVRQADAQHHSKKREDGKTASEGDSLWGSLSIVPRSPDISMSNISPLVQKRSSLTQGLTSQSANALANTTIQGLTVERIDNLDELSSPFPLDEEVGEPQRPEPDWEVDFEEDVGQAVDRSPSPNGSPELNGSSLNMSPGPEASAGLDTPRLNIRSSSSSSGQPISPGFSRPSVREDPQFDFDTPAAIVEPDDLGQGSFYDAYARQSYTKNTVSGSLGESYMQRNAEKMMRRKRP